MIRKSGFIGWALCLVLVAGGACADLVNIGGTPNDGTGDNLRSAFQKINDFANRTVTTNDAQAVTGSKTFAPQQYFNGGITITGTGNGVTFPDGSTQTTASTGGGGTGIPAFANFSSVVPAGHRYYRVTVDSTAGNSTWMQITGIQLRTAVGGTNVATSGTVTVSNYASSNNPFYGAGWDVVIGSNPLPQYAQIYLPTAANVVEWSVGLTYPSDMTRAPGGLYLSYSDDGTTWTVADTRRNQTGWLSGVAKVYDVPAVSGVSKVSASSGHLTANVKGCGIYYDASGNPTLDCPKYTVNTLPGIAKVAGSGDYNDLKNLPVLTGGALPTGGLNGWLLSKTADSAGSYGWVKPSEGATNGQFMYVDDSTGLVVGVAGNGLQSGTGNVARVVSPRLTTPDLGAATATSINGVNVSGAPGSTTITSASQIIAALQAAFPGLTYMVSGPSASGAGLVPDTATQTAITALTTAGASTVLWRDTTGTSGSGSATLTGQGGTAGAGNLSASATRNVTVTLIAQGSTAAVGTLTVAANGGISVALTGRSATGGVGTLTASGTTVASGSATLAGQGATGAVGSLAANGTSAAVTLFSADFSGTGPTSILGTSASPGPGTWASALTIVGSITSPTAQIISNQLVLQGTPTGSANVFAPSATTFATAAGRDITAHFNAGVSISDGNWYAGLAWQTLRLSGNGHYIDLVLSGTNDGASQWSVLSMRQDDVTVATDPSGIDTDVTPVGHKVEIKYLADSTHVDVYLDNVKVISNASIVDLGSAFTVSLGFHCPAGSAVTYNYGPITVQ